MVFYFTFTSHISKCAS